MMEIQLSIQNEKLSICRLNPSQAIPEWAIKSSFLNISKTNEELSIVCTESLVPTGIKSENGWIAIKVAGVLDFSLTGILSSITLPLSEAKISVFAISTFDTDYVLVKEDKLDKAVLVLKDVGFRFL